MKILVTGGREYADFVRVWQVLDQAHAKYRQDLCIIQGGAKGADEHARDWCESRMVCCVTVPALWKTIGRSAGPIRNNWMLRFCPPDCVVAFPGKVGTEHMKTIAKKVGVPVYEFD